jgi:N-methylhydantoinase B
MTLDPVDYAIITQALIAAAREMGAKLVRSAFSTVLREARDGSAALLDARGNTVAQAELIPMQLGTIGHIFQPCAAMYPLDELQEGDFFAINDPYSGGQHLQDVFLFHPIFFAGRLIGFSASVAHHLDLGGGSPGLNPSAADVWAEGLIIPPHCDSARRQRCGGFYRYRATGAAASELAVRIDGVGGAVLRKGGTDQSGHSVQCRRGAAGDDNRT